MSSAKKPVLPTGQVASAQPMQGGQIFFFSLVMTYLAYLRVKMAQQLKGKLVKGPYKSLGPVPNLLFLLIVHFIFPAKCVGRND